jgi:NAD-specific glutamate dehydrogenase
MGAGRQDKVERESCVRLEPKCVKSATRDRSSWNGRKDGVGSEEDGRVSLIFLFRGNLGGLGGLLLGLVLVGFLFVDLLEEGEGGTLGLVDHLLDLLGGDTLVAGLGLDGNLAEVLNESFEVLTLSGINLILELGDGYKNRRLAVLFKARRGERTLLGLSANRISTVGLLDDGLACLVGLSVLFSIGDHILNIVLVQAGRRGDGHGLILVSSFILGGDVNDTICSSR